MPAAPVRSPGADARHVGVLLLLAPPPRRVLREERLAGAEPAGIPARCDREAGRGRPGARPAQTSRSWSSTPPTGSTRSAGSSRARRGAAFARKGSNWFVRVRAAAVCAWKSDLAILEAEHRSFATSSAKDSRRPSPGRKPRGEQAHQPDTLVYGVASHDVYHTGQIQMLKRLWRDRGESPKRPLRASRSGWAARWISRTRSSTA